MAATDRLQHDFLAPDRFEAAAYGDQFFAALVKTKALQRLGDIRFLGGIDYLLVHSPNGTPGNTRHTRYEHSLRVAHLALLYSDLLDLNTANRRLIFASALLHDIGHAPLSHSLEPVFREYFQIDHHKATEDIICGRVPLGREVYALLHDYNVDVEELVNIVSGKTASFHGFFSGPINFDTIEGILRVISYVRPSPLTLPPEVVVGAAIRRHGSKDLEAVDQFWLFKDFVYRDVINSPSGILADFACQAVMRRNLELIGPEDYFSTEAKLFRKLPTLRRLLTAETFENELAAYVDRPIRYAQRRFFVDPCGDFFQRQDRQRYRQTKVDATLGREYSQITEAAGLMRDLFDDKGDQ